MFPGPGAQIYRNEAGEPLGWDYPSDEPYEPDDYSPAMEAADAAMEDAYAEGDQDASTGVERNQHFGQGRYASDLQRAYDEGYDEANGDPNRAAKREDEE